MTEAIPLVNLQRQHRRLRCELEAAFAAVLDAGSFINGPAVRAFESAWLAALGAAHGSACANGTAALELALSALGVGAGDEVICPAHTFVATAEAVANVGAVPVFADIDPASYTLDPQAAAAAVGPRTRAIIPVHIYGGAADLDPLADLARRRGLILIEDAAQAHLARYKGRRLGTLGDAGTFSFYPGKNLGALGDAGFVVFKDAAPAAVAACLLDHGRRSKYEHDMIGRNQRMDDVQAAFLSVKLTHLAAWTEVRRARALRYDAALRPAGFKLPDPVAGSEPVRHLYVVETEDRDRVAAEMARRGVATGVHYPIPLHLQPAFRSPGGRPPMLPATERAAGRLLTLPLCGELTEAEQDRVLDAFLAVARP
jgi:dTDP-4-amino-4,6-dideoxygalactose transaminase